MRESIKNRIDAVRRGEVPEGYRTERAMLFPNEWGDPVPLNTVLTENKDRNEDLHFGKEDVLSVSGEQGIINQIDLLGRSYAGESVAAYHIVETGDVVYTKSPLKENPYGIIKQNHGVPGIVSTLYAVYHCNSPITGQYLENYFSIDTCLNNYLKPLVKRGAKNDMKVNNEDVLLGRIPLPSLQEQERINEIIAQFDRALELKKKLLEEKRRQKQWLMQKLLDPSSGVRLPGFERSEWIETPLSDLCEFVGGGTPDTSNDEYWHGTIPWISSADLQEGNIRCINATRYITEETVNNSATKICPENSILIVSRVGVGKIAIAPTALCTSQDFINLVDVKGNLYFVTLQLQREIQRILSMSQGTSIKGIASKEIKAMVIELPARDEQDTIANVLESSDREITLIETEIKAWQQKKKAIMQLLLTGLARVNA